MIMSFRHLVLVLAGAAGVAWPAAAQAPLPAPAPPLAPLARLELEAVAQGPRGRVPIDERIRRAEEARRRADARRGPEYTEDFSRTLSLGRNGAFELTNPSGNIVVTGGGGSELRIDAVKRVQHPDETQGRALLQAIEIQVAERSGLVDVRTVVPRARNWSGAVDYTIALPDSARVVIRSVAGDVRLSNLNGELRANTVSGNLVASDVSRVRVLRSVSGNVELSDGRTPELDAGTVSGNLTIRDVRGEILTLESVSGGLRLSEVAFDRVRVRSVSGDLEYDGPLARGGRYEFESHSGDVTVRAPGNSGIDLEATTFSGALRSDFELRTTRTTDADRRRGRTQSLIGTIGNASAVVTLRTFSGDVTLTRR
jgi:hypothetical protein